MGNETIATEHKDVRIIPETEHEALIVVPLCANCGHPICPGCFDWCDRAQEDGELCCEGRCVPGTVTTVIKAASARPELLELWQTFAAKIRARAGV